MKIIIQGTNHHPGEVTGDMVEENNYLTKDNPHGEMKIQNTWDDEEGVGETIVTGDDTAIAYWLGDLAEYISTKGLHDMGWGDDGRTDYHPNTVSFLLRELCHSFDAETNSAYGSYLYRMVIARTTAFYQTQINPFIDYHVATMIDISKNDEVMDLYDQY